MTTKVTNSVFEGVNPPIDEIVLGIPLGVPSGGTGADGLNTGGVLIGNGVSSVVFADPGPTGLPLLSNGANEVPTFREIFINVDQITNLNTVILSADLNYYISPTGNDSNDGLTPETPFLTIQRSYNVATTAVASFGNFSVNIFLADGSYTLASGDDFNGCLFSTVVGNWYLSSLSGNAAAVILLSYSTLHSPFYNNNTNAIVCYGPSRLFVENLTVGAPNGNAMAASGTGATCGFNNIIFTDSYVHAGSYNGGLMEAGLGGGGSYIINGNCFAHMVASGGGNYIGSLATIGKVNTITRTIGGSITVYESFAASTSQGIMIDIGSIYLVTAIGQRFLVNNLSEIDTNLSGADYYPGTIDVPADGSTFGIYS